MVHKATSAQQCVYVFGGGALERGLNGERGTEESGWTFPVVQSGGSKEANIVFIVKHKENYMF